MSLRNKRKRLKLWISENILSAAERLPTTVQGPLASFQQIQQCRREQADEAHHNSRTGDGVVLTYASLRLFEIVTREREENLRNSLRHLFRDLEGSEDLLSSFFHSGRSLGGATWSRIGTLVRNRGKQFYRSSSFMNFEALPAEFDRVSVTLSRPLPSLTVVTFDVDLNQSVTQRLMQIQQSVHMPEVEFSYWLPLGHRSDAYTMTLSENVAEREALDYRRSIRVKAEAVANLLKGGFFSSRKVDLPAIEVFKIQGDDLTEDHQESPPRCWLKSLGLSRITIRPYRNDQNKSLFSLHDLWSAHGSFDHVLMVPAKSITNSMRVSRLLDPIAPVALVDYLSQLERDVFSLSGTLYSGIDRQRLFSRFKGEVSLNRTALQTFILANRFAIESSDNSSIFWHGGAQDFVLSDPVHTPTSLKHDLVEAILWRSNRILKYAESVNQAHSRYLEIRTTESMFEFQRRAVWMSVLAAVLGAISFMTTWQRILELLRPFHYLHKN